jgi:phage baseplate assembly protein gpV
MNRELEVSTTEPLSNLVRVGTVSSFDPERHTARVVFADKDRLVSHVLPLIRRGTGGIKDQFPVDVGEQVLCLFLANGEETGFVLGTLFSRPDPPASVDPDEFLLKIPGGVSLAVHRRLRIVKVLDSWGSAIVMKDKDIILSAARDLVLSAGRDLCQSAGRAILRNRSCDIGGASGGPETPLDDHLPV